MKLNPLWLALAAPGAFVAAPHPAQAETQLVLCESIDHERAFCDLGRHGDVRLIRQVGGVPCHEGSNWGADERGVWVDAGCRAEFEVDFPNQRHQQRNAPQQDQGDEDNDEERGQNEGGDRRDERDSRYEQRDHDQASGDRHAGPTDFITCESIDRQRRYCEVGHPVAVRLDRQLSDAACVRGQSWQETPTGVWVAHGCRAVFRIH